MSIARRTAIVAVNAFCGLLGRGQVVRAARFALNQARFDLVNQPETNGEYALHRWVLSTIPPTQPMTVFDVGANVGDWSRTLLSQATRSGHARNLTLHAFEPSSYTYALLRQSLPDTVRVNQLAVSASEGTTTLYIVGPAAGTNSVHQFALSVPHIRSELVTTITIDEYIRGKGIQRVDLLKIDTEGHDFSVLLGAEQSLKQGMISIAQFEYNHRWTAARHFLRDVFDFIGPLGYRIGKLTPRGMETYPAWHPELESFIEGNYLACTAEMVDRLPQVTWWKHQP